MKTTNILGPDEIWPQTTPPAEGALPVMWLIDGEWVHKGWLLPQVA